MEEVSLMESIATTNGSFASTHFLLDGLSWRTCVLIDAGYDNLIKSVVNVARGHQIPHGRLQGFVPHPLLNRSHIEAGTEHASGIRRTKCLQIELFGVQTRARCNRFAFEQHVVISITSGRWKYEPLAVEARTSFKQSGQFDGDRNFSLFPTLR
jgi:hypothetical protein